MNPKSPFLKFLLPITLMLLFIFSSCSSSSTQQIAASRPIDTEAQAIQIASQYLPSEIAARADISTSSGMFSNRTSAFKEWTVYFSNFTVNKSDLGWKSDDKTVLGDEEPYTNIDVNLNGVTGDLVSREAFIPVNWGDQTPSDTETAMSRDQALAIASRFVPNSSLTTAKFYAEFHPELSSDGVWEVEVYNLSISQEEMFALGWANSELSNTGTNPPVYFSISVNIDGVTGAVLRKSAGGIWLGPPPGNFVPQ